MAPLLAMFSASTPLVPNDIASVVAVLIQKFPAVVPALLTHKTFLLLASTTSPALTPVDAELAINSAPAVLNRMRSAPAVAQPIPGPPIRYIPVFTDPRNA